MEWREGSCVLFAADSSLQGYPDALRFTIQPSRIVNGISDIDTANPSRFSNVQGLYFYKWKGKIFLWIHSKNYRLPNALSADYVVISNNTVWSIRELAEHISFERVILDGSNSFAHATRLVKEAQSLNLDLSFVLKDGSYTLNF